MQVYIDTGTKILCLINNTCVLVVLDNFLKLDVLIVQR